MKRRLKRQEVREYFSFYCPHCLRFEPFFGKVKKSLPEGVKFERNHVDFLRFTTPEIQFMLTKALATAQQLKVEDKIAGALLTIFKCKERALAQKKIFVTSLLSMVLMVQPLIKRLKVLL